MNERVRREVLLPASVQDVWDAVISDGWLADEVRLDLRPGGEAYFGLVTGAKTGWVEEVVVPGGAPGGERARLAFWWACDGEPASRVELTLEERHETTRLRIVETRPLELLDLVGVPLPGISGPSFGPALLAGAR
jgi:uncharacterized protein YndB with AHSA1/START domain